VVDAHVAVSEAAWDHREDIARVGIGIAAGAAGGALAGSFCAATAGAGCFIADGLAGRMLVGTAAQLAFDGVTGSEVTVGSGLTTLAFNAVGGARVGTIRGATGKSGLQLLRSGFSYADDAPGFGGLLARPFWS
jgi:hypothetical protein